MPHQFHYEPNRRAGSLLATFIVMFLGTFGSAVMVAGAGGDPSIVFTVFGSIGGICIAIIWLSRDASHALSDAYSWVASRKAKPSDAYIPRPRAHQRVYGTNAPPTVDDLRDAKESGRTWVPNRASGKRHQ